MTLTCIFILLVRPFISVIIVHTTYTCTYTFIYALNCMELTAIHIMVLTLIVLKELIQIPSHIIILALKVLEKLMTFL